MPGAYLTQSLFRLESLQVQVECMIFDHHLDTQDAILLKGLLHVAQNLILILQIVWLMKTGVDCLS